MPISISARENLSMHPPRDERTRALGPSKKTPPVLGNIWVILHGPTMSNPSCWRARTACFPSRFPFVSEDICTSKARRLEGAPRASAASPLLRPEELPIHPSPLESRRFFSPARLENDLPASFSGEREPPSRARCGGPMGCSSFKVRLKVTQSFD